MGEKKGEAVHSKRFLNHAVFIINIVLLIFAILFYVLYTAAYEERAKKDNIDNLTNINSSIMRNTATLFDSWKNKLNDMVQYIETKEYDLNQTLDLLCKANSSEDMYYILVDSSYQAFIAEEKPSASGTVEYYSADYSNFSFDNSVKAVVDEASNKEVFNDIQFVNGFSFSVDLSDEEEYDGPRGVRFLAIYKYVLLNGEKTPRTLMLGMRMSSVFSLMNAQVNIDDNASQFGFDEQTSVLVDERGNFVISDKSAYGGVNLIDYIEECNDLNLNQRTALLNEISQNDRGEFYYKKGAGALIQDCVFRYEKMISVGESKWYCVTSVPLSSFLKPDFNMGYLVIAVASLILLFVVDIVWLNSMNRRLKKSMELEAIANQAKSSFLSRMSHEIRTPLNAIIGYNIIAKDELSGSNDETNTKQMKGKVLDCLQKSEIASKHLLTVINDVLDMSAIESGKIKIAHETFDFRGLITSLTTVFYSQAHLKGVNFEVLFNTLTEEWFVGDQMRINQVLTNLLSNAIKFTSEGGSVVLKITQADVETDILHIHFQISDTGIGMSAEYLDRLFTPFEQADSSISRRFGGSGLGLSIVKNLIDMMNGTITVNSTLGVGTEFNIDLPFERTEQPTNNKYYDFSSVNALFVDDDESTCDYVRMLFNRCGAKCTSVTSGENAVNAISVAKGQKHQYSICIVDMQMPKMDGIETIRRIREIQEEVPIIVLTAYDYSEIADKAAQLGISKFMSKPLFQSSILDLLANLCGTTQTKEGKNNQSYDFKGARVLIAEDNAMNMEIATTILQSAGLAVDQANNGIEAVNLFMASEPGTYKAILMDVHMPEMNGHEATKIIRSSQREDAATVPIIAMTADAFAENIAESIAYGMNDHISKPIDIAILFNVLKRYIQ